MTQHRAPYRAHSFEDLLNTLPTIFGFVPRESVIGVCVHSDRNAFGFRLRHDLPEAGREGALAAELAPHLVRNGGDGFLLFALSADAERARTMLFSLREELPRGTCRVALWADDDRFWTDLPGGPVEGEPYALSDHHEARLHAITEGIVVLGDRAELYAEVAGPTGERLRWLDAAHDHVVEAFVARALRPDVDDLVEQERTRVASLVDRALAGERLTDGDLVEVAVLVASISVRDAAWVRIDGENALAMHAVWAAACRVAVPDFAPAVLSLAGFAAWQAGDGARAVVAFEEALRIDPEYSMARLLAEVVQAGVHPGLWDAPSLTA
ncbi:DUF4192 domain-containing protein [Aeromicrobium sp.]|uniref:DUF4192 domain-containing protein n=1 Tax=Aeromicrobium sp. TaxID=1871063 RepID=UPI0028A6C3CD|nr:DUF4192 domain-containing protein [Aeromicrobium sp.]